MFQDNANCLDLDYRIFFSAKKVDKAQALSACASCLVKSDCLDFALRTESVDGIYGGTTGDERKAMLKC